MPRLLGPGWQCVTHEATERPRGPRSRQGFAKNQPKAGANSRSGPWPAGQVADEDNQTGPEFERDRNRLGSDAGLDTGSCAVSVCVGRFAAVGGGQSGNRDPPRSWSTSVGTTGRRWRCSMDRCGDLITAGLA